MIFRVHKEPTGLHLGISVYNQPEHLGIFIDLIFFYLMFEFKKKGYGHEQSKYN